ncbi:MAG TPA: hypothetical protein VMV94_04790, partial [Phycisphaerae bacterium]|nr:hypothetical protein [Phycisphaerae bacterium]
MNVVGNRGKTRCLAACALALLICAAWLAARASAEERKFVVMLAVPGKSVPGGAGSLQLPNPSNIWDNYFDRVKNDPPDAVDSFAEYWYEISYGTVSVTGDVYGWVEVPWPVLPSTLPTADYATLSSYTIPFRDLNNNGIYDAFEGEEFDQSRAMINVDYNGAADGLGTEGNIGPFGASSVLVTPGFEDYDAQGRPVWTPGERFRDLNNNGVYDALLEPSRDGWGSTVSNCCTPYGGSGCSDPTVSDPNSPVGCQFQVCSAGSSPSGFDYSTCCDRQVHSDPNDSNSPLTTIPGRWTIECAEKANELCTAICSAACTQNHIIDAGEFCDWDGDGVWDFPEPFEDFLVIYNPDSTSAAGRWVKLDPSYKNTDPASRAWAEAYIRANYPGDVGEPLRKKGDPNARGFMARFGNDKYDPPDLWFESGSSASSKLQQAPAQNMWVAAGQVTTPRPDDPNSPYPWDYTAWWNAYAAEKCRLAGIFPTPALPPPPQWDERIPNLVQFDPGNPSLGSLGPGATDLRSFNPNTGGTL